jgi:hypothetical protein
MTAAMVTTVGTTRRSHDAAGWGLDCVAMKAIVIVALVAIIVALFSALVFLYRDKGRGNRMVTALAIRVGLSLTLVAFLLFSYYMGWIAPSGMR